MEEEIRTNPTNDFSLWSELELQEFSDKFVIKSVESPDQGFSVSRIEGNVDKLNGDGYSGSPIKVSTIYGVAGMIRLLAGTYVLVITSRKDAGIYLGYPIFRVTSMKFLFCNEASRFLTDQEKRDEDYFMTLLKIVESTPGLYYSYGTDMTLRGEARWQQDGRANQFGSRSAQHPSNNPGTVTLFYNRLISCFRNMIIEPKHGDPRFVWNRHLLVELIENKLDGFIIPFLQGSFQSEEIKLKGSPAVIRLLSRRCTRRLGTRMWRRGANIEGDTANFVETEQLLDFEGNLFSFVQVSEFESACSQVRGSIPLLWEQIADLSYKPQLSIISHEQTSKVVERHFSDLLKRYGRCIVVDLTDKHGDEGLLSAAYANEVEKIPNVRYVPFDFHKSCANGNLDNIQLLYDHIAADVEKQGYFLLDTEGIILAEQEGIVRCNCIDCLDRTNVTQSFLAQKSLNSQLQKLDVISSTECISMFSEVYEIFKTLWVEHGDEISLEYSGTHALKRDLVRYGKRTMMGNIKDGLSALSRYYLGNFQDGVRQDAIDLVSGRYTVSRNGPSPFQAKGFDSLSYFPVASALVIGGLTVTSITINQAGRSAQTLLSSMVCVGLTAGVMALVKANGRQMCSRPRLCGLL